MIKRLYCRSGKSELKLLTGCITGPFRTTYPGSWLNHYSTLEDLLLTKLDREWAQPDQHVQHIVFKHKERTHTADKTKIS